MHNLYPLKARAYPLVKDKEDAIKARVKAEKEIQGEYSYSSSNDRE